MNDLLWLSNHPLWGNIVGIPEKPGSRYTRLTRELALCLNSQNSCRAPALDRPRAQKTLSNPNRFRQSFHARAIPRTPDKQGSPPALRTFPLSLLYKEWTWEHYRKLNLTFSTLSTERSMGVFIRGLSLCFGWKWGSGGGGGHLSGQSAS
jgi:hypothetical protein